MCVDKTVIAGVQPRHIVIVVKRGQVIRVGIRPTGQVQGFGHALETLLLAPKYFFHRLLHREIQHAGFAVAAQGVLGNRVGVVVEGFAKHEKARVFASDAGAELLPEAIGHPRDGVDTKGICALLDPLLVCAGQIVQDIWVVFVQVRQLGQVAIEDRALVAIDRPAGVVVAMQWVVHGVELLRRQVLMVGHQLAGLVVELAEFGLIKRHAPGG